MSDLREILIRRIDQTGPMSVAEYMTECLQHPVYGYYTTRDPLGATGDFTTAPEISQMFGELIGLLLAQHWMDTGAPAPFVLAELGPGRGTLMADILRVTRAVPGFHEAMRLHLVECSAPLIAVQKENISPHQATWHAHLSDLPDGPLFLVANEFFDALPIRQFQRVGDVWHERVIGMQGSDLVFGLSPETPLPEALADRQADTQDDHIIEYCAPAAALADDITRRIAARGGLALIVDYGDWRSNGDTFQAVCNHAYDDVLAHPGQADLTAHVDFEVLATATNDYSGVAHTGLTPQGTLLNRLGIGHRARDLAARLNDAALESHLAAYRRLTHADEMGTVFKALALYAASTPVPPGFDP